MRWTSNDIERIQAKQKIRGMDVTVLPKPKKILHVSDINDFKANTKKLREEDLQRQCFYWFAFQYPDYYRRMFHIPNGGQRNVIVAAKLKRQGTLAGVWDLFLSVPCQGYSGMFIEIKVGRNNLTQNQIEFMRANGKDYLFHVCYTLEEFKKIVNDYLK